MRTLTYTTPTSSEAECPPKDVYTLELTQIGEFVEKPAFKNSPEDPDIINTQSRIEFQIVDYDYDPDEDDKDWNGTRVADFFVFFKTHPDGAVKDTWKHERSNAHKLIVALIGHEPQDGEDVDLEAMVGRRIKATVEPKTSGWPKITNPVKAKQRRNGASASAPTGRNPFDDEE